MNRIIAIMMFLFYGFNGYSQEIPSPIKEHLISRLNDWDLNQEDIRELDISDQYKDPKTKVTYYYLRQSINGIPVDRSLTTVVVDSKGKIHSSGNGFYPNINDRIKYPNTIEINRLQAINIAASSMKIEAPSRLQPTNSRWKDVFTYSSENYKTEIHVEKVYALNKSGQFILLWKVFLDDPHSSDTWEVFIDVYTGEKISSHNHTIYCNHEVGKFSHKSDDSVHVNKENLFSENVSGAEYLVYALPLVDPREGERTLENDSRFPDASPIGWHATSDDGNFRSITRGNNVHAYEDSDNNDASLNNEPDGGDNLSFIFPNDLNSSPQISKDASITNLFYVNNVAHDLFYILGFNEVAGNFQENNFSNGGREDDYVIAEGIDSGRIGNAVFSTPRDGIQGKMQMYLFSNLPGVLKIEQPANLNDINFEIGTADFGPAISQINIEAEAAFAVTNDQENPTEGCESIINNINNKIALIDRGGCDFSLKVLNAQNAGAVMALICNIKGVNGGTGEELVDVMLGGEGADDVNIPSFFLKKSSCDIIKTTIRNGQSVTISAREREAEGPQFLDSSFDNGVILHEYAHGVSTRLTGGPSSTGCLPDFDDDSDGFADRGEQMGEGWSDYFGLIFTTKVGDIGAMPRGIGTYLVNADEEEGGFRVFPFSTDMDINPLTYDDIKTQSVPHGVGTVWASILWDMYWAMIDLYGFNPDWTDTTSGNYRAAFLVMEGMKLQPCRPGFIDGRNAILDADALHYDGMHEKLIWEAFARRGVGMNADQGSSVDNRDGTEDFTVPPLLIEELKIEKEVSNFVDPGENYNVTIDIVNHIPSTQTGVTVLDELPEGTVYVDGSSDINPDIVGNTLKFNIGDMDYLEEKTIKFQLNADPGIVSTRIFYDDVEGTSTSWTTESRRGPSPWRRVTKQALSGERSWYIEETLGEEVDQLLVSPFITVQGSNPVLRFWHRYEIIDGANGGFIEISTDGGLSWEKVAENFTVRNEYPGELAFSTFAIPSLEGFSGSTDRQWVDSYIDLNDFKGQNIKVRFRFGCEGELVSDGEDPGWFIDEIELMDLRTYSSTACVNSNEDPVDRCTEIQTTVINTSSTTSTDQDLILNHIKVYPNPASDQLIISSQNVINGSLTLQFYDGRVITRQLINASSSQLDVSQLTSGMYFLSITAGDSQIVKKVFITD